VDEPVEYICVKRQVDAKGTDMADGDIFRADEVGGETLQALVEITTASGRKAFAHAALAGGGGAANAANQTAGNTRLGAVDEAAPADDTASSGLNGRLQRIAQRLTTALITPLLAATSSPVTGTSNATVNSTAFTPNLGRPINIMLTGTWTGSVTFQRSVDGGATWQGVTIGGVAWAVFTANCNEPVWEPTEAGATFRVAAVLTTGNISYRIAQ